MWMLGFACGCLADSHKLSCLVSAVALLLLRIIHQIASKDPHLVLCAVSLPCERTRHHPSYGAEAALWPSSGSPEDELRLRGMPRSQDSVPVGPSARYLQEV